MAKSHRHHVARTHHSRSVHRAHHTNHTVHAGHRRHVRRHSIHHVLYARGHGEHMKTYCCTYSSLVKPHAVHGHKILKLHAYHKVTIRKSKVRLHGAYRIKIKGSNALKRRLIKIRHTHLRKHSSRQLTARERKIIRRWRKLRFNPHSRPLEHGEHIKLVHNPKEHDVLVLAKHAKQIREEIAKHKSKHVNKHVPKEVHKKAISKRPALHKHIVHKKAPVMTDNSLQQLLNSERQSGLPLIDINQVNPSLAQNNMQVDNLLQFGE